VVCKPGSITPHTHFKANVYVLSKEEGGRPHAFLQGLPAAVLLPDHRRDGEVILPEGVEMVMPGDNIELEGQLITPIAMEEGLRFAIREGGAPSAPAWSARSSSNRRTDRSDRTDRSNQMKRRPYPPERIRQTKARRRLSLVQEVLLNLPVGRAVHEHLELIRLET